MSVRAERQIAHVTIGVILLIVVLWHAVRSRTSADAPQIAPANAEFRTTGLGCGPAALLAAVNVHDANAASRLHAILQRDARAAGSMSSLYDLATWARHAGLDPIGLQVDARQLHRLPLPAIVHMKPSHFLALVEVRDDRVVVIDQGGVTCEISRRAFDRRFSGYLLWLRTRNVELEQQF